MGQKLLIVGAGGFGREVATWITMHPACGKEWTLGGFLDDDPTALAGADTPFEIRGSISGYQPSAGEKLVCAIGKPESKKRIVEGLKARGAEFTSFVSHTALVAPSASVGTGTIVCPFAAITTDVKIGEFVTVLGFTSIGHDTTVGDWASISGGVAISGYTRIGDGVLVGANATLLPESTVGEWATVGAGSVVLRNVAARATVFGNPAKVISRRPA